MKIKQTDINKDIIEKLPANYLNYATDVCQKLSDKQTLDIEVITKRECSGCANIDSKYTVLGTGNLSTPLMIVLGQGTKYDGLSHTVAYDSAGRYLTALLAHLKLNRNSIYITSCIKCSKPYTSNEKTVIKCASAYLSREINIVKPQKIIAFGVDAINAVRILVGNLPIVTDEMEFRNTQFSGEFNNMNIKVLQLLNIETLISKNGSLFERYKKEIIDSINNFSRG